MFISRLWLSLFLDLMESVHFYLHQNKLRKKIRWGKIHYSIHDYELVY